MNLYQELYFKKKTLADQLFVEELAVNIYHKFLVTHPQFIKEYSRKDKQIWLKKMSLSLRNLLENFEEELELYSRESSNRPNN